MRRGNALRDERVHGDVSIRGRSRIVAISNSSKNKRQDFLNFYITLRNDCPTRVSRIADASSRLDGDGKKQELAIGEGKGGGGADDARRAKRRKNPSGLAIDIASRFA